MDAALVANSYNSISNTTNVVTAFDNNYLEKTLNKVWNALDFLNDHTDGGFFKLRQVSDTQLLKRASHFKIVEGQKIEEGWMSQIQGIIADKPRKIRGDRTDLLFYEELGCHAPGTKVLLYDGHLKNVEDIQIGDQLMGDDGTVRNVIELHSGIDQMYKITSKNGNVQIVNSNHIIYGMKKDYRKTYLPFEIKAKDYYKMVKSNPRKGDGYKLIQSNKISFPHQEVPIDPYIFGYWIGDVNADKARFTSKYEEVIDYIKQYGNDNNYQVKIEDCTNTKKCKHIYLSTPEYTTNKFHDKLRQLNVLNNKHIPDCYIYNDRKVLLNVLAGIIDSNGTYQDDLHVVEITQYENHKSIIDSAALICRILGMRISLSTRISKPRILNGREIKGGILQYRLRILFGHEEIPTKIPRKQSTDRGKNYKSSLDRLASTFKIEPVGKGEFYGFSLDGNQLFLLDDFIVCHNSWPQSTKAFLQGDALVGITGNKFGIKVGGGTGGDSGPNLEGLRLMYEQPIVYDVLPFRHNYTSTNDYVLTGMFIPAFNVVNTPDCIDSRGYTDPEKGKAYYDKQRANKASDQKALLTYIAEYCYTAEEAFSQEGDNKFNKVNIVQQLTRIRALHECPEIQTGSFNLITDGKGTVVGSNWIPSPHGKVRILEHPVWTLNDDQEKLHNLYVAGIDGIDIGKSQTSEYTKDASDFAIVIYRRAYGLRGPQIVATYKDRPYSEKDAYKIAMGLMIYYNAKANIEASRLSMLTWAKEKHLYQWFMSRPASTYADLGKRKSSTVGTPATPAIINHQTDLIKDFTDDYCDDLWFEDVLEELNTYSDENKRKFDYVAAFGMACLADEEYNITSKTPKQNTPPEVVTNHLGYYTDERGIKRYGIIPNTTQRQAQWTEESFYPNYGQYVRTSDPRSYY